MRPGLSDPSSLAFQTGSTWWHQEVRDFTLKVYDYDFFKEVIDFSIEIIVIDFYRGVLVIYCSSIEKSMTMTSIE